MKTLQESINWEWVHAHHPLSSGLLSSKSVFLKRVKEHAKRNGYIGKCTPLGLCKVVNRNLY